MEHNTHVQLTADITAAFLSHNAIAAAEVPGLIESVHGALAGLGQPPVPEVPELVPAVSVRASVKPDYLVCLEDGKKLKMLKRYLRTHHNMSPEEYRARWGLPDTYPMVAPNYANVRRDLAIKIGLGRSPHQQRGRRKKAA